MQQIFNLLQNQFKKEGIKFYNNSEISEFETHASKGVKLVGEKIYACGDINGMTLLSHEGLNFFFFKFKKLNFFF
jgi:hypothetical protein